MAKLLHLPVSQTKYNDKTIAKSHGSLKCTLVSRLDSPQQLAIDALIFKSISDNLLPTKISDGVKQRFEHLPLADDSFNIPAPMDILLGANYFTDILSSPGPSIQRTIYRL